jgi:hypothetical protein
LSIAQALNVPLNIFAHKSYAQTLEALVVACETEHPVEIEALSDKAHPEQLEDEAISSFIVLPGFGSRKRVADTLGNIPEQIANYFDGNFVILHFDK